MRRCSLRIRSIWTWVLLCSSRGRSRIRERRRRSRNSIKSSNNSFVDNSSSLRESNSYVRIVEIHTRGVKGKVSKIRITITVESSNHIVNRRGGLSLLRSLRQLLRGINLFMVMIKSLSIWIECILQVLTSTGKKCDFYFLHNKDDSIATAILSIRT